MLVLVGAYTTPDPHAGRVRRMLGTVSGRRRQRPHGLHAFRLDPDNGRLARLVSTGGIADPSYVAIHPDGEHLYAVSERADGMAAAFRLDRRTGALEPLDRQSTCGSAPCHLTVHPTGRLLFVANYASGTVAVLPIREDGSLGPASDVVRHVGSSIHPTRQKVPHPHSVALDPSGRFALVADLGIDRVAVYRIDLKAGKLSPADPPSVAVPPGQGPRHIVFDPGGRSVFLVAELGCTLTSFGWDPALGVLEARASHSTLPRDALGPSTAADVVVHPNGHLVFASNRGHDSIAVFRDAQFRRPRVSGSSSLRAAAGREDSRSTPRAGSFSRPTGKAGISWCSGSTRTRAASPRAVDTHCRGAPASGSWTTLRFTDELTIAGL